MDGLTDIHCHVLYGVDDGARDLDESLEMLRLMRDEGIDKVILTPHYHGGHMQPHMDTIKERFATLKSAAASDPYISDMHLYLGCEIYYYPSVTEWLEEGRVSSLAGSRYVLLEFGYTNDERTIFDGVSRVAGAGFYPVVAHIERYRRLVGNMKAVRELISRGALIQINSEALYAGFRVRSFVKKLLKNNMVDFVATDAHDTYERGPYIAKEAEYIRKHYGEDLCRKLFIDDPAMILSEAQ